MTEKDLPALRRELLEAAVTDAEGTIRATDTKASIALVLHGLLITGLLGVTKDLGEHYTDQDPAFKAVVVGLAACIGLSFLASALQLLRCVIPAPAHMIPDTGRIKRGVFFMVDRRTGLLRWEMPTVEEIQRRISDLDERAIEDEWVAEALTVAAIRQRKARLVKSGLQLLQAEVVAAVAYLGVLGGLAA